MPVCSDTGRPPLRGGLDFEGDPDLVTTPQHALKPALQEWSEGMLEEDQRALFRELSVFAGTFGLAQAAEVSGGEVNSGHYLAEEAPMEVLEHFRAFF